MTKASRRNFIRSGLALAAVPVMARAAGADEQAGCSDGSHTTLSFAKAPYQPVKVMDTDGMPWPAATGGLGWNVKRLYGSEERTGSHLTILRIPIGGPGGTSHYHTFHEWAYWLSGDFVNNEYTSPYQRVGDFQQFREGTFLDRPPYSLHGGEPDRLDSQVGGTCLIMEEGVTSVSVIPGTRGYSEDFKKVKQWAVPRIIETLSEIHWEPDAQYPSRKGVLVKRLVDDQERGFRATLWRLQAGWESSQEPEFARPYHYKQAYQFNFVLNGDMRIQTYSAPGAKAEAISLAKNFYVERAPMSIFGLAEGVVSEAGCVWLEVTYGKGTSIPNLPIEDPIYVGA
jgi:hypothetical protein